MYSLEEKICIVCGENEITSAKFFQLWDLFDGAEAFVSEIGKSLPAEQLLGNNLDSLTQSLKSSQIDRIVEKISANGITAVTWFSSDYPQTLRNIDEPPYILFCLGDTKLLSTECLSIIGTRKVSSYGRRITKDFTAVLSEYFTIVSGLAYGVDSIAHETTLEKKGKTIAVLGSGVLNIYPSANQGLADRIVQNDGLVISEYSVISSPYPYHFPHRNRIVSGLSNGVLVCQAPAKSGTNSTVDLALDQGKDIFVVPGEIYDSGFAGSNHLIKSVQGACVTTPRDILEYYHINAREIAQQSYQMSIEEQAIVNALSIGPLTFDELVLKTGISPADLNFLLAKLELRSIIAKLAGNSYRLYGGIK